tara:strand:+ start:211 stop:1686 length:1476 start_codon:yes stop_codon:yes gene_type:complete
MIKLKKKSNFLVIFSIFSINMSIKLYLSVTNSLWQDDSWVALGIFADKFSDFQLSSGHHPGFSLIYKILNYLFGFNELIFQLPSLVFSSISVCLYFLIIKKLDVSNYFSFFGIILITLSPTLLLISTRVKPYAFEAFIGTLYLLFVVNKTFHEYKKTIFLISVISLLFSFYTIYVIAGYYFIKLFIEKDKSEHIWIVLISIFSIIWFIFYIRFLPLLNSSSIHPHVYYDWTLLEIIKGIFDGFITFSKASLPAFYLLKWTNLNFEFLGYNFSFYIYLIFWILFFLIYFKNFQKYKKISVYFLFPLILTIILTLFKYAVWGEGTAEEYRMLSSLIPSFLVLTVKYLEIIFNKFTFLKNYKNIFILMLSTICIIYFANFKNYFIYPVQNYRTAIEFIQKENLNYIIRASDGTSPGAALYLGEKIDFGPGLNFSSKTIKSEVINLLDVDFSKIDVIYSLYIENERDFTNLGYQNTNIVHPDFGNLFLGKWEKVK